ncbi:MAG: hypothetical protein WCO84_01360 [bacterium]
MSNDIVGSISNDAELVGIISGETAINVSITSMGERGYSYIHNQILALDTWLVNHPLNKFPSVSVVDSADSVVIGEVQYIDENNLIISFTAVFSGKAYLN